jgi:subtilase family serine protease
LLLPYQNFHHLLVQQKNATGGGFSVVFPRPAYQNHIPGIGDYRGIPDVAYDADNGGIIIVCSSCWYDKDSALLVIGTSAGSPQWAGIVALANQVICLLTTHISRSNIRT